MWLQMREGNVGVSEKRSGARTPESLGGSGTSGVSGTDEEDVEGMNTVMACCVDKIFIKL
jgi:hypothetical protein